MNSFQEFADSVRGRGRIHLFCPLVQFAQVRARRKARFLLAVKNERAGLRFKSGKRGGEALQILEHGQANFVRRWTIERQLDDAVRQPPRERFSFVFVHAFSLHLCGCPILAVFARVGIFGPSISTFPVVGESNPPPFEKHKGRGTHSNISSTRLEVSQRF